MNIRVSKPEAGNKFYTTRARGGFSTCIQGSPTDVCDVLSNCVGYACGRFNEIIGEMKYPMLNCDAEKFIERAQSAGLEIVNVPSVGGIMVCQKGGSLSSSDGAGHVAIVERIDNPNQIYTSESNYGSTAFFNALRNNNNGRWGLSDAFTFRGCIVNPAIGFLPYVEPPKPVIPFEGVSDEDLARRVWLGEFGNGQDRINTLGIRYNAVQALVEQGVGKSEPVRPVEISLHVGDSVEIIGTGNGSSNGNSNTAYGIGWNRVILNIWEGRAFPYQVGLNGVTTGFYRADALRKI